MIVLLVALALGCTWLLVARAHESGASVVAVLGGCDPIRSPFLASDAQLGGGRISYCERGDADTGVIQTAAFPAGTHSVALMLAGYPDNAAVRLEAAELANGPVHVLKLQPVGDAWRRTTVDIPETAARAGFVLRLVDESPAPFGWAGFGTPRDASVLPALRVGARLALFALAGHAWLCLAAWWLPARWPASSRLVGALLLLGVASTSLFFLHLGATAAAGAIGTAALLAPLFAFAVRLRPGHLTLRPLLDMSRLAMPSLVLSVLVLWIGLYPFAGTFEDWTVPALRWRDMPPDNWLPYVLGEMAREGTVRRPMFGDWLSSDRPPMQAGLYLMFIRAWPGDNGMVYQAISTWAQCLVLIPIAILLGHRAPAVVRAGILACVGLSALVVLNGLFVWPKLLAATYCAIFHLLLFNGTLSARRSAFAGAAAGLAMLAHGGALFALAGSAVAFLLARRLPGIGTLTQAVTVAVAVYAP